LLSAGLRDPAGIDGAVATRLRSIDRVVLALGGVFLLSALFYLWTAGTSVPFSLHDGSQDRYNLLASAFLHFHLDVGRAPAALLHLADPYNPSLNQTVPGGRTDATSINDDALYRGHLYFVWGPAPALILLVPLHLLGFEPSASVTVAVYSVAGLGFALAALRVILRQIGDLPKWMCLLAGFVLAFSSVIPFLIRTPSVTEDALTGGFCFTMAGIWLAFSALVDLRSSVRRLALMSLCFGLAAGSRPTLVFTAVILLPVYLSLRSSRPRRELLLALVLPLAICLALLLAYNQARFHQPLNVGSDYQLTGLDSRTAPLGRLRYALPGTWLYVITPPKFEIVFPFLVLTPPGAISPAGLSPSEITGGLLPMAPIALFVAALPWIWRRRPVALGRLVLPLMMLAGAGALIALFASYEFFASTERYETDFFTLFVLGGLAAWLSLSKSAGGYWRRLLRIGGGLLAVWGCLAGLAISFIGYGSYLAVRHPQAWEDLEKLGSPVSTALAEVAGHPVLAEASTGGGEGSAAGSYTHLGIAPRTFPLDLAQQVELTIVAPSSGSATLAARVSLEPVALYGLSVAGPQSASHVYLLPERGGSIDIPVRLNRGLNHVVLALEAAPGTQAAPNAEVLLQGLSVKGG
jgi:hypothetical protein